MCAGAKMPGRRAEQIALLDDRQLHRSSIQKERPGEAIVQDLAHAKRYWPGHSLLGSYSCCLGTRPALDCLSHRLRFLILLNVMVKDGYRNEKQTCHHDSFFFWMGAPMKRLVLWHCGFCVARRRHQLRRNLKRTRNIKTQPQRATACVTAVFPANF